MNRQKLIMNKGSRYGGKNTPIIDSMTGNNEYDLLSETSKYVVIIDVIGKGMIQQIGILLRDVRDIFQMVMSEICLQIN